MGTDSFVGDLIGVPFSYGGRGPDSFDCYGLVRHLHALKGVDIPDYQSPSDGPRISAMMAGELRLWKEAPLRVGATILFKVPGNMHVGTYLGKDRFIHTWESSGGVVVERLSTWQRRVMGIYEYVGAKSANPI